MKKVTHHAIGRPCMCLFGEFLEMAECSPYATPKTIHAIRAEMPIAPSRSANVTGGLGSMEFIDEHKAKGAGEPTRVVRLSIQCRLPFSDWLGKNLTPYILSLIRFIASSEYPTSSRCHPLRPFLFRSIALVKYGMALLLPIFPNPTLQ